MSSDDAGGLLAGPPDRVAPLLLGSVLRCGDVAVRLSEVEAYAGADDAGSHAARGRTPRNSTMFGPAGRLYCYFTYGMHVCANVVVGAEGRPAAVLLRAGEVVEGLEVARARRPGVMDSQLARGPALLCRTLALDLTYDGADLLGPGSVTWKPAPDVIAAEQVSRGPRVGLRGAAERPWRWWITGDPTVSAYRPAAPRRRRSTQVTS